MGELRNVINDVAREVVTHIEVSVAIVAAEVVVVGRPVVAHVRNLMARVPQRITKLRADAMPRGGAKRGLKRVVLRIRAGGNFRYTGELRERAEKGPAGVRRLAARIRQHLVDIVRIDQLASLIADIANLD